MQTISKPHRSSSPRRRARPGWRVIAPVIAVLAVGGAVLIAVIVDSSGPTAGVRVSMTEMAFAPDPIVVPADDAHLTVVNDGALAHVLLIPELAKGSPDLGPGEQFVLDLSDQPAGTYDVICDLPGHLEAGMRAELTLR